MPSRDHSPFSTQRPPAGSQLDRASLPVWPSFACFGLERGGIATWDLANNRQGTFTGATPPTWAVDQFGGPTVNLNPATSQITFPSAYPHIVPPLTVIAIITPTTFASGGCILAHDSGANTGFRFQIDKNIGTPGQLLFTWGAVLDNQFTNLVTTVNVVNRVAVTVDKQGGTATGYMRTGNGAWKSQAISIGTETAATPNRFQIGSDLFSGIVGFPGRVSMVAAFPIALSAQEVMRLLDAPFSMLRGPGSRRSASKVAA